MDEFEKLLEEAKNLPPPKEGVSGYRSKKDKKNRGKKGHIKDPLEVVEKTIDALMKNLNITHAKARECVEADVGITDMIFRAATDKNAPRNVTMDIILRAFETIKNLYIQTHASRAKTMKNVDVAELVGEREEWIDKELKADDLKIPVNRDILLALSFNMFTERSCEIGKRYKASMNKAMKEVTREAEEFKQTMMDDVPTVVYGTNFESTMEGIDKMCIKQEKKINPMLSTTDTKEARYETKLAVTWTMYLCRRVIEWFYRGENQAICMLEVFWEELEEANPFCEDSGKKTWEEMQDAMLKVCFDAICKGPFSV